MAGVERAFEDVDIAEFQRLCDTGYIEARFVPRRAAASIRPGQSSETSEPAARSFNSRAPSVDERQTTEVGKTSSSRAAAGDSKAIAETVQTQVTQGTKNTPFVMKKPKDGSNGASEIGEGSSVNGRDVPIQSSTTSPTLHGTRPSDSGSVLSRPEPSQALELHP